MKLLGQLYLFDAFETARAADAEAAAPRRRAADEPLGPIASTPETAAAWRRWRDAAPFDGTPRSRRSLALPTPRPTI